MTIEQQIYDAIYTAMLEIKTTNEYASGKNYETNIGNFLQLWLDKMNAETSSEVFEIHDANGEASDEQEPIQHEILNLEFIVSVKKGENTASYLRSAKADIYRVIGKYINTWRSTINASIKNYKKWLGKEYNAR